MKAFQLLRRPAFAVRLSVLTLLAALTAGGLLAQSDKPEATPIVSTPTGTKTVMLERTPQPLTEYQSFHLANVTGINDATDVQTALRNTVPNAHIFYLHRQNTIAVRATAEDMALARRVVADLDQPHPVYRLTYTLTEIENGKRQTPEHDSMLMTAGNHASLRRGLRVPIETGASSSEDKPAKSLVEYQDVGLAIDTWLESGQLRAKVELSSLSPEKSGIGPQDPVIEQSSFESYAKLTPGKPILLGSVEMPGGGRQEIEVLVELVP
jgi:type II secretory pathway component GspD/PulD (secretin)